MFRNIWNYLSDCWVMVVRCVKRMMRNLDVLLTTILMPILMLLCFYFLFGKALQPSLDKWEPNWHFVDWLTPGIIVLCIGYTSSTTAMRVKNDLNDGIIDRFKTMPIARTSFVMGYLFSTVLMSFITISLVIALSLALGFHPYATFPGWLGAVGIMLLYAVAFTLLAIFIGIIAPNVETAGIFSFAMLFLPYLSSGFMPIQVLPGWLQGIAKWQPVNPVIETVRWALFHNKLLYSEGKDQIFVAIGWLSSLTAIFLGLSTYLFLRKSKK